MGTEEKVVVKSGIFEIANPDLPIHYATFYGATMITKTVYSWASPIVKRL